MKHLTIIVMLFALGCSDDVPKSIMVVERQSGGPNRHEKLFETNNMARELADQMIADIKNDVSWNWSRFIAYDDRYCLIGKMGENGNSGSLYVVERIDGKWKLKDLNEKKQYEP